MYNIYAISASASGETKATIKKPGKKKFQKERERKKYEINEIEIVKSCFFFSLFFVVVITQNKNCNEILIYAGNAI